MALIPEKRYFKIGEVSKLAGVEPYTIRYWEKEFPCLKPARAGSSQRLYRREHVALILNIRDLVHNEKYTLAGARKKLENSTRTGPLQATEGEQNSSGSSAGPQPKDGEGHAGSGGHRSRTMDGAQPEENGGDNDPPRLFNTTSASRPDQAEQSQTSPDTRTFLESVRDELKSILRILSD